MRIRVLFVDDSPVALAVLVKLVSTSPDIEVVGMARNGKEALDLIPVVDPAVVCTDLDMPVMDGLELTRTIMARCPRPVLVVSALVQKEDPGSICLALEAGAIDTLAKPRGGIRDEIEMSAQLIEKIKVLSGVIAFRKRDHSTDGLRERKTRRSMRAVAVGASAGGPRALDVVLSSLPENFPFPILCVQHIGAGHLKGLLDWLNLKSKLDVRIARPGEKPEPGTIYFPEEGTHLIVDYLGRLANSLEAPVDGHRPSITATFKSVAGFYGSGALGVLLTGMGEDGARGLKAIADAGGVTIAQDERTSTVFGMPRQAIEIGAARHVLPVDRIAEMLLAEAGSSLTES